MSGEFSFSEFEINETARTKLRERAEAAEAALEKAKGIMSNMAQAGSDTELELELARHRQIVHEVTLLIDMIAAMPERPGVVRVRELRARAARVRAFLARVLR